MAQFHHVGVPSKEKHAGEQYLAPAKVYITDPEKHPYRFEFLRFEKDTPLPKDLRSGPHVAYKVDDLDAALEGEQVVIPPFEPMPTLRVAFIRKDGVLVEVMQEK